MILGTALPSGGAFDADAEAFLVASANDGDPTISAATHQLFTDLKDAGIYTKMKGLWLIVGGTAAKHKWNAVDPRDLDAAFRLTFVGAWTHGATGMNASGSYPNHARTFLVPSAVLTENDTHLAVYSRTNNNVGDDIGAHGSGNGKVLYLSCRTSGNFDAVMNQTASAVEIVSAANADGRGFYVASRRSSTDFETYKNGVSQGTYTIAEAGARPDFDFFIGDRNFGGAGLGNNSQKEYALISVGDSLTDQNVTDYTTAVQAFETTLGRAV